MKAIVLGAFGSALLASAASAAPLNATTIGSVEVSNVDQVGLVCNEYYGRCWRRQVNSHPFRRVVKVRCCEGLRMPAHRDSAAHTGAGVRKPPREETAGWGTWMARRWLWGFECRG